MKDKTCLRCKSFCFDMGEPDYSEMTPGYDAYIKCGIGHWEMSNSDGVNEFCKNIETARTCKEFEVRDA